MKQHNYYFIFSILIMMCVSTYMFAQDYYETPKHSMGLELNYTITDLMRSRSNVSNSSGVLYRIGHNASFVIPYQYASKSTSVGFQSGLGLFIWSVNPYLGESTYALGLPLALQFKTSKSFWIEGGFQVNALVYNTMRHSKILSPSGTPRGEQPPMEFQGILGFRYHLIQSLAFKFRIHYGLSPAYHINYSRYRFVVFETGMSYLFPLKK